MIDRSYFYVRSDNNEPRGRESLWSATPDEKKFLRNSDLSELMYDDDARLWGRDFGSNDWHCLHGFDGPGDVIVIGLRHMLLYGELEAPVGGWGITSGAKIRIVWDVMESNQWSAYWRGSRFVFHCEDNQIICTHIYWLANPIEYLEQYLLGQNLIDYVEMHNLLEW